MAVLEYKKAVGDSRSRDPFVAYQRPNPPMSEINTEELYGSFF